jgi:hypothetical protein
MTVETWAALIAFGIGMAILLAVIRLERRVQTMEYKLLALLRHFELAPPLARVPSDRVKQIAADPHKKIEAIRAFREETGLGLKEAKAVIEEVIASQGVDRA